MLTTKLNSKDNSIGLLLNDDALYQNLNATSANAASLLKDLQEHPKRYVHFSLFGKKTNKKKYSHFNKRDVTPNDISPVGISDKLTITSSI